jgi:aspartate racemase
MKTIGIIGGLGPESTIEYYNNIIQKYYELNQDYSYPHIIIDSQNFQEVIDAGYYVPNQIKNTIKALHLAGADFAIAACNSIHIVFDEVVNDIPIPWINIIDTVAEEIHKKAMKKVGLLGTIFTMDNGFYQKRLANYKIETITPSDEKQQEINSIIFTQLVKGVITNESKQIILNCIEELDNAGAEGIILGCTELPIFFKQKETTVPLFDTNSIHIQKALDIALEKISLDKYL